MPAPLIAKEEVLDRLLETFRAHGYDGASLAALSAATGLGKSSLYHYFPGGKADMAAQVLTHLDAALERDLLLPLRAPGPPAARLDAMLATLGAFYDDGRKACLLERLSASVDHAAFGRPLARTFGALIDGVATLCRDAGLPADESRGRAEDAIVRIEGALVVAAGTGDATAFGRALARIRSSLLAR